MHALIGAAGRGAAVNANADRKQARNNYGNARHATFANQRGKPFADKTHKRSQETKHGKADGAQSSYRSRRPRRRARRCLTIAATR